MLLKVRFAESFRIAESFCAMGYSSSPGPNYDPRVIWVEMNAGDRI